MLRVATCIAAGDSLESLYNGVERRRVKAIKADISGKADRAEKMFVQTFQRAGHKN